MALNCFPGHISMHKVHLMALAERMGRRGSSPGSYGLALHTSVQQIKGKSLSLEIFLETKWNKFARVALCVQAADAWEAHSKRSRGLIF